MKLSLALKILAASLTIGIGSLSLAKDYKCTCEASMDCLAYNGSESLDLTIASIDETGTADVNLRNGEGKSSLFTICKPEKISRTGKNYYTSILSCEGSKTLVMDERAWKSATIVSVRVIEYAEGFKAPEGAKAAVIVKTNFGGIDNINQSLFCR